LLTVYIRYKSWVVYMRPFKDHKKAIDHFVELHGYTYNDSVLAITNETEIQLGPTDWGKKFIV